MSVFLDGLPIDSTVQNELFAALAGSDAFRIVVGDRQFEWDLSHICVMVGINNFRAVPDSCRAAFSPLGVGYPFLVWGRREHDAIFSNEWKQRLNNARRIIASYNELSWLIDASDATTGYFRNASQFFALEGLLGVLYETGEHAGTSSNQAVHRGWVLHSSLLQDESYMKMLIMEIERQKMK
jgi:hypothetical protein